MNAVKHSLEPRTPQKTLAIGAHPDDIEVGAGGLVARLSAAGSQIMNVTVSVPTLFDERLQELEDAAKILGVECLVLNRERPLRTEDIPMYELVAQLDRIVGAFKPDLVLTHTNRDLHWDHGLVHSATIAALRRWPCDFLAYTSSYEMNAQVRTLGRCFADITDCLETKIRAISAHKSQIHKIDVQSSRDLAKAMGRVAGVECAEAFDVLRIHY